MVYIETLDKPPKLVGGKAPPSAEYANLPDGSNAIELKNPGAPVAPVPFIPPAVEVKAPVVGLMAYVKMLP
jgi:hypothetical protein